MFSAEFAVRPYIAQNPDRAFSLLEAWALDDNEHEVPQLADALAFLACKVTGKIEGGDHIIYAAEVIDGVLNDTARVPMVRIRKNGLPT